MSALYIRLDSCELYHRCVVLLYTHMPPTKLCSWLGDIELFAEDRQQTFFKIDLDIQKPPSVMRIIDWRIVTITLKSADKKPIGLFINLFYKNFPHPTTVNHYDDEMFFCDGDYRTGNPLSNSEFAVYERLSSYMTKNQQDVVTISNEFRSFELQSSEHAVDIMINLAQKYKCLGGHWLCFFQQEDKSKYEIILDYLMTAFLNTDVQKCSNRFNAKISPENLIVSFGNDETRAVKERSIMHSHNALDSADPKVKELRSALDRIYKPEILGNLNMKYKPEIVSNCCVQRNGIIRPTVYRRSYSKWYMNYLKELNNGELNNSL
ncbi:hypothetical protein Ddc_07964 [Ditylenchus destructor]|nr:hypothetical protein Ddc_07964 [Ditylenchus destructor]